MRTTLAFTLLAATLSCVAVPAAAQPTRPLPTKPVTLVVPITAGSGSDTIARLIATKL
ncbi:MAG: hypothetical protein JWP22_2565, partial [Ramlibacter sp.]|nr:hypothetical protein [Ramlibacter sp.]